MADSKSLDLDLETVEDSLSQYGFSYSKIKTLVVVTLVFVVLLIGCSSLMSILKTAYSFTMKT